MIQKSVTIIQGIFRKTLEIIETRTKVKIRNAVLIIHSDHGTESFVLRNDSSAVVLGLQFFNDRVVNLITTRQAGQLMMCGICLGKGERLDNGILITCDICKGGGEIVAIVNSPTEKIKP